MQTGFESQTSCTLQRGIPLCYSGQFQVFLMVEDLEVVGIAMEVFVPIYGLVVLGAISYKLFSELSFCSCDIP